MHVHSSKEKNNASHVTEIINEPASKVSLQTGNQVTLYAFIKLYRVVIIMHVAVLNNTFLKAPKPPRDSKQNIFFIKQRTFFSSRRRRDAECQWRNVDISYM